MDKTLHSERRVPEEPTEEMIDAGARAGADAYYDTRHWVAIAREIYKAMLAAAPAKPRATFDIAASNSTHIQEPAWRVAERTAGEQVPGETGTWNGSNPKSELASAAATEGPTSETWTKAPEGQVRTCPPGTCRVQSPVPCNCFADPIVAGELAAAKAEVADLAADREVWIKRTLDAEEKLAATKGEIALVRHQAALQGRLNASQQELAIVKEEFLQYKSDLDALISRLRKPLVTDNSEGAHE